MSRCKQITTDRHQRGKKQHHLKKTEKQVKQTVEAFLAASADIQQKLQQTLLHNISVLLKRKPFRQINKIRGNNSHIQVFPLVAASMSRLNVVTFTEQSLYI